MGEKHGDNVHCLDEWRAQQRHKRLNAPRSPWMYKQRGTKERLRPERRNGAGGVRPYSYTRTVDWTNSRHLSNRPHNPPLYIVKGKKRRPLLKHASTLLWLGTFTAIVLIGLILLWTVRIDEPPSLEPSPPIIRLWTALDEERLAQLDTLLAAFERQHDVQIDVQNGLPPLYDLVPTLTAGYGPDVMLVDYDTGMHLFAFDALQPLADERQADEPTEGAKTDSAPNPEAYILPMGEDSLWVHALRAVIPRHARHKQLARQLVSFVADWDELLADDEMAK